MLGIDKQKILFGNFKKTIALILNFSLVFGLFTFAIFNTTNINNSVSVNAACSGIIQSVADTSLQIDPNIWLNLDQANTDENCQINTWKTVDGRNANSYSSNKAPLFKNTSLNNKPALSFDGNDDGIMLDMPLWNGFNSVFIVAKSTRSDAEIPPKNLDGNYVYNVNDSLYSSAYVDNSCPMTISSFSTFSGIPRTIGYCNAQQQYLFTNKVKDVSSSFNTPFVALHESQTLTASDNLHIGAQGDGNWNGKNDISEVIVFNRAITRSEREKIICYLSSKYAIATDYDCILNNKKVIDFAGFNYTPTNFISSDFGIWDQMGAKYIRTGACWDCAENPKGVYDFTYYDNVLNGALSRGVKPYMTIAYGNHLYNEPGQDWRFAPTSIEGKNAFKNFVLALVNRYQNKGIVWGMWNEPDIPGFWANGPNADDYYNLINPAVDAIKSQYPNEKIGGPVLSSGPDRFNFMNRLGQLGLLNKFDYIDWHPYSSTMPYLYSEYEEYHSMENQINPFIKNPIFMHSEVGYDKRTDRTYDQVANQLMEIFANGIANDIDNILYFMLNGSGPACANPAPDHECYELYNANGQTKAFKAAKTYLDLLGEYRFNKVINLDYALRYDNLDRFVHEYKNAQNNIAYLIHGTKNEIVGIVEQGAFSTNYNLKLEPGTYKVYNNQNVYLRDEVVTNQLKPVTITNLMDEFWMQEPTNINLSLKANLSGTFNTTTNKNNTFLRNNNLIPLKDRPSLPNNSVDWITVELWQGTAQKGIKEEIIDENGNINISFENISSGLYKVILRHRNHLAIATNSDVNLTAGTSINTIDFTTNTNVKSANQTQLKPNIYGLILGNSNNDNFVDAADRNQLQNTQENSGTYSNSDLNLDGIIDASDRNLLRRQNEGQQVL